jgi:hypothetical protein
MSTSKPKNTNKSEEIDLGVLFNAIGNGISKLFKSISNFILFVLNAILQLAVFVRKRIVYFALASILGLAAGVFLEHTLPPKYIATATVEPHFDSARQLYTNVLYLNDLAAQSDSVQLASFFGFSLSEAASLIKLEITPFVTKTSLLQEYNNYKMGLDSLVATEMSYKQYVKQINDFERKRHMLKVESTQQDVFSSLLSPLITSVSKATYFKDQQVTQLANLELMDSITQVSIVQADSLLSLFEEVRIIEANKAFSNGTNLYMSESTEDNAEIALLNRKITLSEQIEKIRLDKLKARNVVDIVASFSETGYLEESFWKNKKTQGTAAGLLLLSLFYLTIHLDGFLKSKN